MTDSLLPAKFNLQVWEGASLRKTISLLSGSVGSPPQDLTGYTATLSTRATPGGAVLYTLSTVNGQISLGGTAGTIQLYIPSADTSNPVKFPASGGVYELTITAPGPGDTSSLMWGTVQVQGLVG